VSIILAVDPGTGSNAWARVWNLGMLIDFGYGDPEGDALTNVSRIVVESQEIYAYGHERPNNIVTLARSAGLIAGKLTNALPHATLTWAAPKVWAKQVPKLVRHRRLCNRLGWQYRETKTSIQPLLSKDQCHGVSGRQWYDVLDAIDMGLWASKNP
jgi:hypothetical protein